MSWQGHGHGKVILCGEHAVVYGVPALACAVDLGTTITLSAIDGPTQIVAGSLTADQQTRLEQAIHGVVGPNGCQVRIDSTLPMGRGMGSSAALGVALVRAWAASHSRTLTNDDAFAAAMPVERVFHGNPSGLDVACAAHGGVLRYQRQDPPVLEPLNGLAGTLVVLDSGTVGCTADLVAHVGAQRPTINPTLDRIGALVDQAVHVLDDPHQLGPLLTENHAHLKAIGVSTPTLDDLVALALDAGAHGAKLSGAGGGGIVIALCTDPAPVLDAARRHGVSAMTCTPVPGAQP